MVLLYLASGLFHAAPACREAGPVAFATLQAADRPAIFLRIAGTNTPVIVALLLGRWRAVWLAGMWGLAAAGVAAQRALPRAPYGAAVSLYVGMGWLGGAPLVHYYRAVGWRAMNWAVAGGVLYTAGAACDLFRWPVLAEGPVRVGPHEVFHLAVVAAGVAFYGCVARHVLRYAPPPGSPTA